MNYAWDWGVFTAPSVTGEGSYGGMLLNGLAWTVAISLLAWSLALGLGLVIGTLRTLPQRWLAWPSALYVHCLRNTPLLVQLFLWFFVLPELVPERWGLAIKQMNPTANQFVTVVACLTLYTAAKVAEQVRAGIQSVPGGQRQAALALGLSTADAYRCVLLPQALRIVTPPLTSDFLNTFKNSAVALTVGLMELTGQSRQVSEFSAQPFEAFIAATLVYMVVSLCAVGLMRFIEARTAVPGGLGAR
jgi:glutamate/aspartate transport system permease protein